MADRGDAQGGEGKDGCAVSDEPARIVRVTGYSSDTLYTNLFALDDTGALWVFEHKKYAMVWTRLPPPFGAVVDLYTHIAWDGALDGGVGCISGTLRVLTVAGRLYGLRWADSGYFWDEISLEQR